MNNIQIFQNISILTADWSIIFKLFIIVVSVVLLGIAIYDRFIQRENQLLINYPLIGRVRYFFYLLRNPMRQYFGDETFYNSFEKLDWINTVAANKNPYLSFSPTKPYGNQKTLFKHANFVKELKEVQSEFSVTFGANRKHPFVSKSIVGRSAMSEGAISPEGTRAFTIGAYKGSFPINTGEGATPLS